MPYLLNDSTHLQKLANGKLGKKLDSIILKQTGLRPIAYFERGSRHLTSNRPIKHPDELNGIILRIPNVPSYVGAWQAMGAKPTPMALSEVFTGLQQGTVEAQENPFAMIYSSSFYEVQKYLNLTEHVKSWGYVLIGEKQFQSLPKDLQAIFLETAKDMQKYEHQLFLEKENWLIEELKKKGMQIIEVDKEAFRKKGSQAVYQNLSPEMLTYFKAIQELAEK